MSDKAKKYLEANPEVKEVFQTSDGFLFTKKYDAQEHANSLNADSPVVETYTQGEETAKEPTKKDDGKKPTPNELKAIKEKAVADYSELFGTAPDPKLSAVKIQELIDAKIAEVAKAPEGTGTETAKEGEGE